MSEDLKLYVIVVLSNPRMFARRYQLFDEFIDRLRTFKGISVLISEMTFGNRPPHYTRSNSVHVSSKQELWVKENLINIGVRNLPKTWKYLAWIDADIEFINKDWVSETIHALQHYPIVQLFQNAIDMDPKLGIHQIHHGFGHGILNGKNLCEFYCGFIHPGYAWAMTREAYDATGGLVDFAILGAADHHMACAVIGQVEHSFPSGIDERYKKRLLHYQERWARFGRKIGHINGIIVHHWHGRKSDRKYAERWNILIKHKYNPEKHLMYDSQGLIQLADDTHELQKGISQYFVQRNEDVNSVS